MTPARILAHCLMFLCGAIGAVSASAAPATPLFASDEPIRITLQGPIGLVSRNAAPGPQEATLSVQSVAPDRLRVHLSPRGITRLKREVCQFAPLRVDFAAPPPPSSIFSGQSRLKLVTHCRHSEDFQQKLLLEYSAYRLFNALTPLSYRVRLAHIDYVEADGRPLVSRLGFFIEDIRDVGSRNGLASFRGPDRILTSSLSAADAARVEIFEYMISNYDWSLRSGPVGYPCCHNAFLLGPNAAGAVVPVPYDFDFSGLVAAPYATVPDIVPIRSVRQRRYRGFCAHDAAALQAATEFRCKRAALLAVLDTIPEMTRATRASAADYLGKFFDDIADDRSVERKLLSTCFN